MSSQTCRILYIFFWVKPSSYSRTTYTDGRGNDGENTKVVADPGLSRENGKEWFGWSRRAHLSSSTHQMGTAGGTVIGAVEFNMLQFSKTA